MNYTGTKNITATQAEQLRKFCMHVLEKGSPVAMKTGGQAAQMKDKTAEVMYENGVLFVNRVGAVPKVFVLSTGIQFDFEPVQGSASDSQRKRMAARFFFETMAKQPRESFYLDVAQVPKNISDKDLPISIGALRVYQKTKMGSAEHNPESGHSWSVPEPLNSFGIEGPSVVDQTSFKSISGALKHVQYLQMNAYDIPKTLRELEYEERMSKALAAANALKRTTVGVPFKPACAYAQQSESTPEQLVALESELQRNLTNTSARQR